MGYTTHETSPGRNIRRLFLAAGLAAGLGWAYWPTLIELVQRWWYDPRYSHGFLVPVFALVVLWSRRDLLTDGEPGPNWWGLPLVGLGAALRLAGAYFFVPWFEEISLLPTLAGLLVLAGGWPGFRWAWPGVLFLVFMLPLPYQAEVGLAAPLQRLATAASTYALQTLGIPAVSEGNIIRMDDVEIGVVEACSGLGMLMTFFALSTAVALLVRRPVRDRVVIFLSAAPIGVLVNVVRITVTGALHYSVSSELADLVFHDLAGWLMMPLALGLLWLELLFLKHLYVVETHRPVPVAYRPAVPEIKSLPRTEPAGPGVRGQGSGVRSQGSEKKPHEAQPVDLA